MPVITPGSTIVGAVQISGLAPNSTPIESWLNGLLQGKAYARGLASVAVAAQSSYVELRNPAGSGKNLWVYSATAFTPAATTIQYFYNSPPTLAGGIQGLNLLSGLYNSVGFLQTSNSASFAGAAFSQIPVLANTLAGFSLAWVMVVAPNCSLTILDRGLNEILTTGFFWMEV